MIDWLSNRSYPQILLVVLVVTTSIALLVVASTSTAAFGTYNPAWDGAADLRSIAVSTGAEVSIGRTTTPYQDLPANRTVAVLLSPTESYTTTDISRIRRFLDRGGTLVVADDFGSHSNRVLNHIGANARIDGVLLRDERHFYRTPAMPVTENISSHQLTANVDSITFNYASAVRPNGSSILVSTSGFAYRDTNRNGELDTNETLGTYPVVTVERVGEGQIIVIGDPSMLINAMLDRSGNRAFVRSLFESHTTVLLDYSHTSGLPPLSTAILILRNSSVLQFIIGVSFIAGIGIWTWRNQHTVSSEHLHSGATATNISITPEEFEAFVKRRHPDWDDDHARRIVQGIINRHRQSEQDTHDE